MNKSKRSSLKLIQPRLLRFLKDITLTTYLTIMYYIRTKIHKNVYNFHPLDVIKSSTGQYDWPVLCTMPEGTKLLLEGVRNSPDG